MTIEVKAYRFTTKEAVYQLIQYLKASDKEIGIFVNFGIPKADIIRKIYTNDRKPWLHL